MIKFFVAKHSDIPLIMERGGKPADIYYDRDTEIIYIVDRDGATHHFALDEVEKEKIDSKPEEGYGNFDSKTDLLDGILRGWE